MGRFARSWAMTKTSFRVVWQDKELLWLPVLSFLATLVAVAGVLGIGFVAGIFPQITRADGSTDPMALVLGFASYILVAFVQVFFHAATVAGANERLAGGDPTVGSALRGASRHMGRLLAWAVVLATVNVILQMLRERAGALGRIAAGFAGIAWNLATYFVVPALMFEDRGIGASLKRSGNLFRKTWGESVVGEVGIGMVGGLVALAVGVCGVVLALVAGTLAGMFGLLTMLGLTAVALVIVFTAFAVASAVYKTALYRYASSGQAGGAFDQAQMAHAYHSA